MAQAESGPFCPSITRGAVALFVAVTLFIPTSASATTTPSLEEPSASPSSTVTEKTPEGRPRVHLDQLTFAKSIDQPQRYEKHLRQVLRRETRRARWGAGRENRIEYRFELEQLEFHQEGDVLRVTCRAIGRLPKNKSARSQITFGGKASERDKLVRHVLEIVSRGVITRLAELERRRRGLD